MKVYVDELPKSCRDCPCCYEDPTNYTDHCRLNWHEEIKTLERPADCPLQTIADHDKQVRKQVCDEIRKFYISPIYNRENAHTEVRVLLSRLDQIEKGE